MTETIYKSHFEVYSPLTFDDDDVRRIIYTSICEKLIRRGLLTIERQHTKYGEGIIWKIRKLDKHEKKDVRV